ncbi:hypothetical protein ASD35_10320 [Pelomonas sp. Root1444]|nr:hypothetical protein ASD35_10320 [Pelomonas sp. Root1444]
MNGAERQARRVNAPIVIAQHEHGRHALGEHRDRIEKGRCEPIGAMPEVAQHDELSRFVPQHQVVQPGEGSCAGSARHGQALRTERGAFAQVQVRGE